MKRSLIFFAAALLCAVSCGSAGVYSEANRFQDGIYYKPNPRSSGQEPKSEEEFRYRASLDNFRNETDSTLNGSSDYWEEDYPYRFWRPYHWGWHSRWSYYYDWGYPYYWGSPYYPGSPYYYGWYDPWDYYYWGYGWYDPYYYRYPYYGWGYGRPYYGYAHSGTYARRAGSATSGRYYRSGSSAYGRGARTASAAAQRDIDRLRATRNVPRTTAINRGEGYSETRNYRTTSATRARSSASYNSGHSDVQPRSYDNSSSSYRSSSSSRSSGGGGYSGGSSSHSSGHSSHSSSGGSSHGGGRR